MMHAYLSSWPIMTYAQLGCGCLVFLLAFRCIPSHELACSSPSNLYKASRALSTPHANMKNACEASSLRAERPTLVTEITRLSRSETQACRESTSTIINDPNDPNDPTTRFPDSGLRQVLEAKLNQPAPHQYPQHNNSSQCSPVNPWPTRHQRSSADNKSAQDPQQTKPALLNSGDPPGQIKAIRTTMMRIGRSLIRRGTG
jgi:hypothetical protein